MLEWHELIADWAWARHHNEWSWYIRPFIMIGFCVAAWYRHRMAVVVIAVFFPISAVIFPAPDKPKPYVVEFLKAERELLEALTSLELVAFSVLVVIFLWLLALAFWRRSLGLGLIVANLGGAIKLSFGYVMWGETGGVALLPTLLTALVFNSVFVAGWFINKRRRLKT